MKAQTTIGKINASEPGFVDRVFDRIASHPDGLRRRELRDLFLHRWGNAVSEAVRLLIEQRRVVEVTRTHGTDRSHLDHKRLMVLKSNSIGGVR